MLTRSRERRNLDAASTCSSVMSCMTPRVRWMVPMGRIAFGGIWYFSIAVVANLWRESCNCGFDCWVTRGRHRKWVSRAAGMVDQRVLWADRMLEASREPVRIHLRDRVRIRIDRDPHPMPKARVYKSVRIPDLLHGGFLGFSHDGKCRNRYLGFLRLHALVSCDARVEVQGNPTTMVCVRRH